MFKVVLGKAYLHVAPAYGTVRLQLKVLPTPPRRCIFPSRGCPSCFQLGKLPTIGVEPAPACFFHLTDCKLHLTSVLLVLPYRLRVYVCASWPNASRVTRPSEGARWMFQNRALRRPFSQSLTSCHTAEMGATPRMGSSIRSTRAYTTTSTVWPFRRSTRSWLPHASQTR